ncbi:SMP-30/gluconolactonase/LRE family protein [Oceanicoccus sp. KOV_DT_Chl]|uniref:SMP-30/gluconolactonase/LRE family protein n=1 Tax=Oceanicoccus sp. KOV_DT_Chl TaxID=1904639 RepID=UPI000C7B71B9|nr:SMP-30/gluconolactonase/LRE family protein [Oceanicoccus sp. KOV_DT_Chl]
MDTTNVFDQRICTLGEGILWHPLRQQLFWFDIIGKKLLTSTEDDSKQQIIFKEHVSAAGWIDHDHLLIASESALSKLHIESGSCERICPLEADKPNNRSNDGRADPWGGFWIGTMGKNADADVGAIYRYYQGEVRQLFNALTIPNAICFSPDRRYGFFTDTTKGIIWRQALNDTHGWPQGEPTVYIDFSGQGIYPDGAVIDQSGQFWNAQWGASRVACYDSNGHIVTAISLPTSHITCPAFGGKNLSSLYATSATQGLSTQALKEQPHGGKTFIIASNVRGQAEHRILL